MPKRDRHDQSAIWQPGQFEQVSAELSPKLRALFAVCYYSGCRISEARQLTAEDLVGETLVLRKATTKTKRSRSVPIHPQLQTILAAANLPSTGYLFPGRSGQRPLTRQACDAALRKACDRLGLRGFSTHSNRRTWATRLDQAGVRLKTIQELGGWTSMAALQRYLDVSTVEKVAAIAKL